MKHHARSWRVAAVVATLLSAPALAEPDCKPLIERAQRAWEGASCDEKFEALAALDGVGKSGCSSEQESTEVRRTAQNLESSLRFHSCGCESLQKLTKRVRAADAAGAECTALLDTVGQLRSHGKCRDERVLVEARMLEAAFTKQVETKCSAVCDALPQTIAALAPKEQAIPKARCLGCPSRIHAQCGLQKAKRAEETRPAKRLADLRADLVAQNMEFQNEPTCRTVAGCPPLEDSRLTKLTAYLELLHAAKLTEVEREQERTESRTMLRAIGLKNDVVSIVLGLSASELKGMANLSAAAGNPETRELLATKLSALDGVQFGELIAALRAGASFADLLNKATGLNPDNRQKFFRVVGVGMDETRLREAYLQQLLENQFEIVRPREDTSSACNGCSEFWGVFSDAMTAAQPPHWTYAEDVRATLAVRVQERKRNCASSGAHGSALGCGAVMSIELKAAQKSEVVPEVELYFIVRSREGAEVRVRKLEPMSFSIDRGQSRLQQAAASALATSAAFAFDRLRGSEVVSTCQVNLLPSLHCGVSVGDGDDMKDPPPRAGRIVVDGSCDNAEFQGALATGLRQYGLESALSLPRQWSSSFAPGNPKCTVTLQSGKEVYEDMYSVAAAVLPSEPCSGASLDAKWGHAGEQVALRIARYMAKFSNSKRSAPSYWHAFYFSGARQLEYSNGASGWEWAAGETALVAAGVAFTVIGIHARNDVDPATRDMSKANAYLGAAFTSFGLIIPLRGLAGLMFHE